MISEYGVQWGNSAGYIECCLPLRSYDGRVLSLYIDLCNCLILICSIRHQIKVNLWTKNSYRLWLTNWPKTSKPLNYLLSFHDYDNNSDKSENRKNSTWLEADVVAEYVDCNGAGVSSDAALLRHRR